MDTNIVEVVRKYLDDPDNMALFLEAIRVARNCTRENLAELWDAFHLIPQKFSLRGLIENIWADLHNPVQ